VEYDILYVFGNFHRKFPLVVSVPIMRIQEKFAGSNILLCKKRLSPYINDVKYSLMK